jgi:Sec-independent protein secretion pathway component TatC
VRELKKKSKAIALCRISLKMFYLKEAKLRIYHIFPSFIFTPSRSYFFRNQFISFPTLPLKDAYFYNTSPERSTNSFFHLIHTESTELSFAQIRISSLTTFPFPFPFIIYQFRLFPKPGPYMFEKHLSIYFSPLSFILPFLSLFLTYFPILPSARKYLPSLEASSSLHLHLEAKVDKYSSLVPSLFPSSSFFFQLPFFFFLTSIGGFLNFGTLVKKRKFVYFISLFLSIFLSTPDFFSQFPFILLFFPSYESSSFFLFFPNERESRRKPPKFMK